jgi:hypothetical protein
VSWVWSQNLAIRPVNLDVVQKEIVSPNGILVIIRKTKDQTADHHNAVLVANIDRFFRDSRR